MSIAVEMPPAMMTEARSYAVLEGSSVEQFVFNCLKAEMARRRASETNRLADAPFAEKWLALVRKSHGRLTEPYTFNRADAYPEGEYA